MSIPPSGTYATAGRSAGPGGYPLPTDLQQVRLLAEHLPQLVWTCLPDGHCDFLNHRWVEYTGVPERDHHGAGWLTAIHPDDRERTGALYREFIAGRADYDLEYRLRRHDGEYRWFKTRGLLLRAADRSILRVFGTCTDIDAQKRAEEELRESRERLEAALAASGTGTFRWDIVTNALDWDEQLDRLFGLPPGQTVRSLENFVDRVHPDDREGVVERCRRCKADGADFVMEFRVVLPDGTVRWLDDRGRTVRGPDGRPAYMTGACVDVTDRKRIEAEAREAGAVLRGFYDTAPVMMGVVEVRGSDIVHVTDNAATYQFFGAPSGSLAGRRASELGVAPEHLAEWVGRYREAERTGRPVRFEYEHQSPAGPRWVSAIVQCIDRLPDGGCRCSYVAEDVTDRKRMEERLREAEDRATFVRRSSGVGFWYCDLPFDVLEWDEQVKAHFHLPPDAHVTIGTFYDRIHPADREPTRRAIERSINERETYDVDYRTVDPETGAVRWVRAIGRTFYGPDGSPRRFDGVTLDVTTQKQAEEALKAGEERFRAFMDNSPAASWVTDTDGRIRYISATYSRLFALPDRDLVGATAAELYPPEFADEIVKNIRAVAESGRTLETIERGPRADGSVGDFLVYKFPLPGPDRLIGGVAFDVTDRVRAQAAVRASEERFRQLADAMPQIVWTAGQDGVIDYSNRRWNEFSGSEVGTGNEGWGSVVHPEDMPKAAAQWAVCLRTASPFEMELRLFDRRAGAYRWHLMRTVPVRDERGQVTRWYGTATDVDDQKRAGDAARFLADASAALAAVTDYESTLRTVAGLAVPHFADWAAVDVLADGKVRRLAAVHTDPAKVGLAEEFAAKYPIDPNAPGGIGAVLRTGRSEMVPELTDEMLVRGARDPEHLRLIRALGLRSYVCVPMTVAGRTLGALTFATAESARRYGPADLALAEDLGRRAAIAVENARLYAELRAQDRRKDEFLATLAHELRNPLAPIRNGLHVLKLAGDDVPATLRTREMMERQLGHMVRLVDDLLDVSRISRNKLELRRARVELRDVISAAVETARPAIEASGHGFVTALPPEPIYLDADLTRLAQVFANLLTNSAKYTPRGGQVRLSAVPDGDQVTVTVADTGIGIPADALPTIFDMFSQVDRPIERTTGGLGIGLALVKGLVEMHGGTVTAASDGPGRGCEFAVRLPITRNAEVGTENELPAPSSDFRVSKRVLVADDNLDAADSMAALLTLLGHDVRTARDGLEAVAVAEAFRPDLVLMDVGMPKLNGYDATRRIREAPWGRGLTVVALTGWGQDGDRASSRAAGCDGHLVKPVELADLQPYLADPAN